MTEQHTDTLDTETPAPTPAPPAQDEPANEETSTSDPLKAARREAGNYRRQLREAEAARDELRAKLDTQQWGIVAANLKGLKDVEPLKSAGRTLDQFLADDGTVDPAQVQRIEAEFAEATGLRLETQRDRDLRALGSMDAGRRGSHTAPEGPTWSDAIKGK